MHIKFLAHGTGSGARASAYLMGPHDHTGEPRAGVAVLRGDPVLFAAVADSLPFQQRYSSAVISWAAEEAPRPDEISAVLDDFEALAFAGLAREDVHLTAVEHAEADGGVHVHILIPRVHLGSGKSFNPAPPGQRKDFDAVRDKHNHEKGWARPDDPLRARLLRPDFEAYKAVTDHTAIKKQLTDHLIGAVAQGVVSNAAELRAYLQEGLGCEITRTGKDYTSVKPEGYPKAMRLKGELYGESWTAQSTLEREAQAAARAGIGRGGEVSASAARDAQERLAGAHQRRAEYNRDRYQGRDRGLAPADLRREQALENGLDGGQGRSRHAETGLQRLVQSRAAGDFLRGGVTDGKLVWHELDMGSDRARHGDVAEFAARDQQRPEHAGRVAEGGELLQGGGWQTLHHRPQDWGAVQDRGGQDGRGGALNDRAGAGTVGEAGADRTAARTTNRGLEAAIAAAGALFERVAKGVQRCAQELWEAMQRPARGDPDVGERGNALEQGYQHSARELEQQCQRLEQGAGELAERAGLINEQAKELKESKELELSLEYERYRGLEL
ncbi:mobilization protein [Aeromonas caviae]|nr:mobilization protein [Aeromonas caviae]